MRLSDVCGFPFKRDEQNKKVDHYVAARKDYCLVMEG